MKVSLNSIRGLSRRYGCSDDLTAIGVGKLTEKVGAQLGGLDEVIDLGARYNGIVIVTVVECEKHTGADKLHVCKIDDGGVVKDVERDEKGYVQVVCGAPNVAAGQTVAWLPPGSTVPESVGKEPFVLTKREIRGVLSNGMLASPKELALGDSHSGILVIDGSFKPGTDFAEAFELKGDTVLDIENKMFTHRPDLFGFLGIARELAGIQRLPFKSPDWYAQYPDFPDKEAEELPLTVRNELPNLVPRFSATALRDVKVGPSPVWLQVELAKVGQKSVNNIVDYTNFFMLETAQPLHAYDYDKVKALSGANGVTMVVRNPHTDEKLTLLNGKEIQPRPEAILIASDKQAIGLGGVMGGVDTEVDEHTTNIILECATFDMYSVRRTSMAHGLFTDAVTRFTKGQSPLQNLAVLAKITDEIRQHAGGKVASNVIDDNHIEAADQKRGNLFPAITVAVEFINARLGLQLSGEEMAGLLSNVEFEVGVNGDKITVQAPFWRTDIELREDIVEEIGRLYGYDQLPLTLPRRDLTPASKDRLLETKDTVRDVLARAGANEVLTYSFVHGDLLEKVGQNKDEAFRLSNALSPDLQYYRLSLTPSLLEKLHPNSKAGYDEFALFELGKAHVQNEPDPGDTLVPKEVNSLALVFTADAKRAKDYAGAAYYQAKKYLVSLLAQWDAGYRLKLEPLRGADLYKNPWVEQMVAPYEPGRSAVLRDENGLIWGVVGEFRLAVQRSLKLSSFTAGFELDPLLFIQPSARKSYVALSKYPKVSQDISLKVPANRSYQEVFDFVWQELATVQPQNSLPSLGPVDIYQGEDTSTKNFTLRLTIASYERTLTDQEVNKLLDTVAAAAKTHLGAERL